MGRDERLAELKRMLEAHRESHDEQVAFAAEARAESDVAAQHLAEARARADEAAAVVRQSEMELARIEHELHHLAGMRDDEVASVGTFAEAVSRSVRNLRETAGYRQQDLADRMSRNGFPWQRLTVTEVEKGSRRVSLDELVMLAAIFRVPVLRILLPGDVGSLALETRSGEAIWVDAYDVRDLFVGDDGKIGDRAEHAADRLVIDPPDTEVD